MTVKLSSVKADLAREAKGDWVDFPDWPGVAFKVSSLLLPAYRIDRDLLGQRLARQHKGKPIPPDVLTTEVGKLYQKHILHDWRGFDQAYSKELAGEMLVDPEYRAIVSAIEWCAAKIADIDVEFIEDAAKNSERPSETA
jgi:hypothetical protein